MLSVITVSLNAEAEIGRTLSSLASQTVHPFEHLVVDGGSTDATPNIVKQRSLPFTRLIQQVDCGAYDAMNKATLHARGKYVMFLNAGDTFAAPTVLSHLERAMHEGKEIIVGDHYYYDRGKYLYKKCESPAVTFRKLTEGAISLKWLEGIPCHQSTVYRKDLLNPGFDTSFEIAADHELLFRSLSRGVDIAHLMKPVAIYHGGGFSAKRLSRCQLEWYTIAAHYTKNLPGVHAFYSSALGYRLPERQAWIAGEGLDEFEGPYADFGIDFVFRWMVAKKSALTILGAPPGADLLRVRVCASNAARTLGIVVPACGIERSYALSQGPMPIVIDVRLPGCVSLPLPVRLTLDGLSEEHSGRRKLGIMVLDAGLTKTMASPKKAGASHESPVSIGMRRMLKSRRSSAGTSDRIELTQA
jgi:hypothetical protein